MPTRLAQQVAGEILARALKSATLRRQNLRNGAPTGGVVASNLATAFVHDALHQDGSTARQPTADWVRYFGFTHNPFDCDSPLLLAGPSAQASHHLRRALQSGRGYIVVTGPPGVGKTTMVQAVLRDIDAHAVAWTTARGAFGARAVEMLVGGERQDDLDRVASRTALKNLIEGAKTAGKPVVVCVDDAHLADVAGLESLRAALNPHPLFSDDVLVVLIGRPQLATTLEEPAARAIATRVVARLSVPSWSEEQLVGFLQDRINGGSTLIGGHVLQQIARGAGGSPALCAAIARETFRAAASAGAELVDDDSLDDTFDLLRGSAAARPRAARRGPAYSAAYVAATAACVALAAFAGTSLGLGKMRNPGRLADRAAEHMLLAANISEAGDARSSEASPQPAPVTTAASDVTAMPAEAKAAPQAPAAAVPVPVAAQPQSPEPAAAPTELASIGNAGAGNATATDRPAAEASVADDAERSATETPPPSKPAPEAASPIAATPAQSPTVNAPAERTAGSISEPATATSDAPPRSEGRYALQVASYAQRPPALRLQETLSRTFQNVEVVEAEANHRPVYRVRVAGFERVADTHDAEARLKAAGFSSFRVSTK